jgi:hypothetical protein
MNKIQKGKDEPMRIRKLNPDLLLLKWGMGGKRVWENDGSG